METNMAHMNKWEILVNRWSIGDGVTMEIRLSLELRSLGSIDSYRAWVSGFWSSVTIRHYRPHFKHLNDFKS